MFPTRDRRASKGSADLVSLMPPPALHLVPAPDENLITRYSLVCHETRTKVVVGANGCYRTEMLSALGTDDAREALCAFFMHNRSYPLELLAENWAEERSFPLYHEFSDGLGEVVAE
ncbi:hypothetical protein [Variovorax sp. YR216]|uniref:hypothetical protein n=1 Tax=Variovorax sp. YR216 TaxID=1882828 RepID=UPI000895F1BE|nr:hypothetical protein [Variovorax sp. YR216]SEB01631.1 hypothetical protein SAMN05444680_105246 [Variovorax sp. YR216]